MEHLRSLLGKILLSKALRKKFFPKRRGIRAAKRGTAHRLPNPFLQKPERSMEGEGL